MVTKEDIWTFQENYRILAQAEGFIYLLPHPKLREWISNYTITFPSECMMPDSYTIMPHGSATLVVTCDNAQLSDYLFGPATKPCIVGKQAHLFNMLLIIEFQPAGLFAFTGINQSEMTDRTILLREINFNLSRLIVETVESAKTLFELISGLDILLLTNMYAACPPQLKYAIRNIIKTAGNISVKGLSDIMHYSERHINRIFEQNVGVSIKSFSRLVRINNAIHLLQNHQNSISLVSDLTGFYDLPHFIHDFKSIAGITPQEYRNNMSDFYNAIAKF